MSADKYLSPVSGNITTKVLFLFSGLFNIWAAAQRAAPDEIPASIPSDLARHLTVWIASSSDIVRTSSIKERSNVSGIKPAPIPWILCFPATPLVIKGEFKGSTP